MDTDKKLFHSKINDLFRLCERRAEPVFSSFLDGGELAFIEDEVSVPYGFNVMSFGGYDGAERRVFGVFPEWSEPAENEFPLSLLRVDAPKFRTLTHRDYLGTLMSLGIDRSKTGDILTDDNGAYIFVSEEITEYVAHSLNKIANIGVTTSIADISAFEPPKPKTEERGCVCASLRLDAVVAAAEGISRAAAEKLIRSGCVKLNHREAGDRSKQVKEGDLLSVRGYGRCILKSVGYRTRSGRTHIVIEKFI